MDKSETYYRMQIKKMTKPNLRDREWSTDCHGSGSREAGDSMGIRGDFQKSSDFLHHFPWA